MKCRDSSHDFFGTTADELKALAFLHSDGTVQRAIKEIVLSAAVGEELEMTLQSPIKD